MGSLEELRLGRSVYLITQISLIMCKSYNIIFYRCNVFVPTLIENIIRLRLDSAETFASVFFPFFFSRVFETCGYCSCTVQWTVAAKLDFSNFFRPISTHRVLFIDLQISLFSNFFIKNGFHGTIYTFKNYFATVFFSFQLYPNGP